MSEVTIKYELNAGDIINIYTDYQDEVGYEGKAELVEKIRDGDSFYISNERIKPEDCKEFDDSSNTVSQLYSRITYLFKGNSSTRPSQTCVKLYKELVKLRKSKITEFSDMKELLGQYRKVNSNPMRKITNLLDEFDDYYIIRYIQQDRTTWHNTIFSFERWKVRFIEDHVGWESNWTTARNIRVVKCWNPKEGMRRSELVEHTTYDGLSSRTYDRIIDIYAYNNKKSKEELKELNDESSYDGFDNL